MFTPRLTENGMKTSPWWYSSGNPFYISGYGLPNCTCYSYGRYAEIRGSFAKLPTGNAGDWYTRAKSAFPVSDKPVLGSVACWKGRPGSGYNGHVGIVEEIYPDGSFLTSNSAWKGTYFFTYKCFGKDWQGSGWMKTRDYLFEGFLLQTENVPVLPVGYWSAKNTGGYSRTSAEARNNAIKIYRILTEEYGWKLPAICGLLGNIDAECGYNFWLWENGILKRDSPLQYSTKNNAYGFVQWTPASGYTKTSAYMNRAGFGVNYQDSPGKLTDAEVQLYAIHTMSEGNQWLYDYAYPRRHGVSMSYRDYKVTDNSPEWCAECFMICYERPYTGPGNDYSAAESSAHLSRRKEAARYWYDFFSGFSVYQPSEGFIPEEPEEENIPAVPSQPEPVSPAPSEKPVEQPENTGTGGHIKYPAKWHAKHSGFFIRDSQEAVDNAQCIFNILYFDCKWSIPSICALLGVIEILSGYNPWHWTGDFTPQSFLLEGDSHTGWRQTENPYLTDNSSGYGLIQFSPASVYLDRGFAWVDYAPDFRNPVWEVLEITVLTEKIYVLVIHGYSYTGNPEDGNAQCYVMNEIAHEHYPELCRYFTTDFSFIIKEFLEKIIHRDFTPDELRTATQASRFWFNQFTVRKFPFLYYQKRRQIIKM